VTVNGNFWRWCITIFSADILIILSVVLYGSETWSLTLGDMHRVFEDRVLRKIFRQTKDKVTGDRRASELVLFIKYN
jgi:hypothetical protein